jgi:hypothetical protein
MHYDRSKSGHNPPAVVTSSDNPDSRGIRLHFDFTGAGGSSMTLYGAGTQLKPVCSART